MAFKPFKILKGLLIKEENTNTPKQIEITPGGTSNTKTTILASQTTDKTLTLPDATDTLVGKATTDVLTNKSIDADTNTITNIENADIKAAAAIDASKIANGTVSNAEFQQIDGLTSSAVGTTQAQTLTSKTISGASNTISNVSYSSLILTNSIVNADIATGANIDASKLGTGVVDNTEFNYLNGVTSSIQTQLNSKLSLTGGTLSGALDMGGNKITSLGTPTVNTDAVTKLYADNLIANVANKQLSNLGTTAINSALNFAQSFAGNIGSVSAANSTTLDVYTGDASTGTSGTLTVSTGNAATANNNTGDILLRTGTVSGTGVRGKIRFVESSLATASVGHVWALSNTSTGQGSWTAPATAPATVAFRGTNTAATNITTAGVVVPFTEHTDTNNAFVTDTFTVPSTGYYSATACLTLTTASFTQNRYFIVQIQVNSTVIAESVVYIHYTLSQQPPSCSVSIVGLSLTTSDTIRVFAITNEGTRALISYGPGNFFSIVKE